MAEGTATNVQRPWEIAAVALVVIMLTIILAVPRLHECADRRACLARIQAFATAMKLQEAEATMGGLGNVASPAVSTERNRIAARYVCPTTKKAFVYLGGAERETSMPEKRIIAYEPYTDQHGKGGCVVYANGEGEFLPAERYRAVINSLKP